MSKMSLSKCVLLVFVSFLCIQFMISETKAYSNVTTGLLRNTRASRLQRGREQIRFGYLGLRKNRFRCSGNPKQCRIKSNFRLKYPFRNRKKDKRCCKKLNKLCQRRLRKHCKKTKCFIKQSRKCQKQFSRCNKRKSINRRPGRCPIRKPRPYKPIRHPEVTSKPKIKKREKEECTRSEECAKGLCCARHQHVRICKPLIQKNQVCTREYKSIKRSPEMFERCPCAEGLSCSASKSETRHYICQTTT